MNLLVMPKKKSLQQEMRDLDEWRSHIEDLIQLYEKQRAKVLKEAGLDAKLMTRWHKAKGKGAEHASWSEP